MATTSGVMQSTSVKDETVRNAATNPAIASRPSPDAAAGASIVDKMMSMDEIQNKTGKSKHLQDWNFFASDRIHLRDILQYTYIIKWFIGMCFGVFGLFIVEYCFVNLFKIHMCDVPNNKDYSLWQLPFGSGTSFAFAFQQLCRICICWGGSLLLDVLIHQY